MIESHHPTIIFSRFMELIPILDTYDFLSLGLKIHDEDLNYR